MYIYKDSIVMPFESILLELVYGANADYIMQHC